MRLHYLIDKIIRQWLQTAPSNHFFAIKWYKWVKQGIQKDHSWIHIKNTMGITTYQDYVTIINTCPLVQQLLHILVKDGKIHYLQVSDMTDNMDHNLNDIFYRIKELNDKLQEYEIKSESFYDQIQTLEEHLQASHHIANERINSAKNNINQLVTQQKKSLLNMAKDV
jgi:hypothetical protein